MVNDKSDKTNARTFGIKVSLNEAICFISRPAKVDEWWPCRVVEVLRVPSRKEPVPRLRQVRSGIGQYVCLIS